MSTEQFVDITMPSLGADMTEGMLVQWLVKPGDNVKNGDVIAVLETQKGAIDMEAYQSGRIEELLLQPVVTVPVGTVLARLRLTESPQQQKLQQGENQPETAVAMSGSSVPVNADENMAAQAGSQQTPIAKSFDLSKQGKVLASPVVRQLAATTALDLTTIQGSGPGGAVLLRDLATTAIQKRDSGTEKTTEGMRSAIAAAMLRSKREIPHFYLSLDIPLDNASRFLHEMNGDKTPEQQILLIALLLKAIALTLRQHPQLNGFYVDGRFLAAEGIHIGNVISLRSGGMVVPAIHRVDELTLQQLMQALRDVSARSRSGHLRSSELTDATITVTNMGERGADTVYGVIYPPQVAIIGIGRPRMLPCARNGDIVIAEQLTITLSADHRVIDGMAAAKFLAGLEKNLQQPEIL